MLLQLGYDHLHQAQTFPLVSRLDSALRPGLPGCSYRFHGCLKSQTKVVV